MEKQGQDRRIEKTERQLREALVSLVLEKPYDAITVKEILDRANVGRSTFYTHFRDKDALLVSGIRDILDPVGAAMPAASAKQPDRLLWFCLPILQYHQRHRQTASARIDARGRAILHEHLRKVLVALIEDELRKEEQAALRKPGRMLPPDLLARYLASTIVLMLNWWIESGSSLLPQQVDDLFRQVVLPMLAAGPMTDRSPYPASERRKS